jgi:peptidoglycan/LPS O-acetylase OafA/YrhL
VWMPTTTDKDNLGTVLRTSPSPRSLPGPIQDLIHRPPKQNSFLDGLRSIAILLVINVHYKNEFIALHGINFYSRLPFIDNGWIGVDLFFVLSGFFIGGQLWKELRASHDIHIGKFLLRRGFRIWPLYYFTCLAVLILNWQTAKVTGYGWPNWVFLTNYHYDDLVRGSWSLATEEQFYILTPVLLYLFARKLSLSATRTFLWALLLFLPCLRALIWMHDTGHFRALNEDLYQTMYIQFHTHCDGLIMGLILSNLWVTRISSTFPKWKSSTLVVLSFVLLALTHELQPAIFNFFGLALFFGSLVWFGLTSHAKWFDSRIFYWISRLSFGMYLNHFYLVVPVAERVMPHLNIFPAGSAASQILGTLVLTLASMAVSLVTFCLIEYPFLQLRSRLVESHPA